jgi:hypothetical protein
MGKNEESKQSMDPKREAAVGILHRFKCGALIIGGAALISFASGALLTARLTEPKHVRAESNRVFELMIYHTLPGKAPQLESVFRNSAQLKTKYGLNVIGYWVPNEDPAWRNTVIYLIAHPSREAADKNWQAFHADPAFLSSRKAAEPLIEKANDEYRVDEIYMRPTDFSAMK